jgi:hypothetical protein
MKIKSKKLNRGTTSSRTPTINRNSDRLAKALASCNKDKNEPAQAAATPNGTSNGLAIHLADIK